MIRTYHDVQIPKDDYVLICDVTVETTTDRTDEVPVNVVTCVVDFSVRQYEDCQRPSDDNDDIIIEEACLELFG